MDLIVYILRIYKVALFLLILFIVSANAAEILLRQPPAGDNRNFIIIMGKIVMGDDYKFKAVLTEAVRRGLFIDTVVTYSPGGAVGPALKIGRSFEG